MRILITGADGFIGRRLLVRAVAEVPFDELVAIDLNFREEIADGRIRYVRGSIANLGILEEAFAERFDLILHLACIAGGQAEEDFALGREVNLVATMNLLELVRVRGGVPVFVYASSVGVYGAPPAVVEDETPARPNWSYGTHKAIGELLVTDYTRKGWIDGRTLRLPGVVARPADPSGAVSAFLSDLIRSVAAGRAFTCPVSAEAVSWWMSRECCIDNLFHGMGLEAGRLGFYRTWLMPPLRASIAEVVDALATVYGVDAKGLVTYAPVAEVEARFGRLPPTRLPATEALGFRSDGSVEELVRRALV